MDRSSVPLNRIHIFVFHPRQLRSLTQGIADAGQIKCLVRSYFYFDGTDREYLPGPEPPRHCYQGLYS
jgi:hypothetical protein